MAMNYIERPGNVFRLEKCINKRAAHVVYCFHKIRTLAKRASVVMHAVNALVPCLIRASEPRKNMNLVAFTLKSSRKFRNVHANPAHANRMHGFPRKYRYPHIPFL
jgi:hypothetical protein